MNPPLRSEEDRQALLRAVADGTITAIATDHAPHTVTAKLVEFDHAPFGIIGLETALSVTYTELVASGMMELPEFVKRLTTGPADILRMNDYDLAEGKAADITVFDPEAEYVIDPDTFKSKSRNTPFGGRRVRCRNIMTIVGGNVVYEYGK
jgi:dihydroorotase